MSPEIVKKILQSHCSHVPIIEHDGKPFIKFNGLRIKESLKGHYIEFLHNGRFVWELTLDRSNEDDGGDLNIIGFNGEIPL